MLLPQMQTPPFFRPVPWRCRSLYRRAAVAFTLVELLVVMAVIAIIIGISGPALTALNNAGNVNKAAYDIAGTLEQSRTYAMSNNTYVYVGIAEVDAGLSSGTTPQKTGTGRISIAVVATKDGTQGFNTVSLENNNNWSAVYPTFSANLAVVGKPLVCENLHIPADLGKMPTAGGLVRPALSDSTSSVGNTNCLSVTPFDYPLSAALDKGKYSFKKVVQFDPQGIARVQTVANPTAIAPYIEIDLQQSHGTAVSALPTPGTGNVIALQIDGMTGVTHIYRP